MKPLRPLIALGFFLAALLPLHADNLPPNFRGTHEGSYTYGATYEDQEGERVSTSIKISQLPESAEFYGTMTEAYANFGVPKEGKLWSDIEGMVSVVNGEIILSFTKTYRYFDQDSVTYVGVYLPEAKEVRGIWYFKSTQTMSGSFQWNGVTLAE